MEIGNGKVVVFRRAVPVGVLPSQACLSWLYFWADGADPLKYLAT